MIPLDQATPLTRDQTPSVRPDYLYTSSKTVPCDHRSTSDTRRYYDEAVKHGVTGDDLSPDSVRAGFKPGKSTSKQLSRRIRFAHARSAFKEMEAAHPMYGKFSDPPLTPAQWWTELIRRCMVHAGAASEGTSLPRPPADPMAG